MVYRIGEINEEPNDRADDATNHNNQLDKYWLLDFKYKQDEPPSEIILVQQKVLKGSVSTTQHAPTPQPATPAGATSKN